MALVNGSIPNMFNGVSQQPDPLRHPSQCSVMDNAYATIATGLKKRPPTEHVAKIRSGLAPDAFMHLINRDALERYVVVMLDGDLEVYHIDGTSRTVSFPSGKTYLNAALPREDFDLVTVADFTFIVNKTKTVVMDGALSPATLTGTKQKFSDLPAVVTGQVYKIEGDDKNRFDDYYVLGDASGVWVETVAPSTKQEIDATTMPHTLVRNGDGTFTFDKQVWDKRLVGSTTSNKTPSFIDAKLNGIFFHRNRLGIHSGENIIMSRAGKLFNFWTETVLAVLDSDPVDIGISHTKVSILNHVVPFDKTLLMFSDQTQFQLNADKVFTPKTVNSEVVTEFESSSKATPVGLGKSVYFAADKATSSQVREYFVDDSTVSNDASDVTAHVPSYVPANIFKIAASSAEDVVMFLSLDNRNHIYVYKVWWNLDEKAQSAWSRFVFPTTDTVLSCDFINSTLYVFIQRADGIYIEKIQLQEFQEDTGLGFLVHLDRKQTLTGSYDSVLNLTTWTLPFSDTGNYSVVLDDTWSEGAGSKLPTLHPTGTTITAVGDHSAHSMWVGRDYKMIYRFSEQYVRDSKNVSITTGKLVLKNFSVNFDLTGFFQAEVTPRARPKQTYKYTGMILGDISTTIGKPSINSGTFKFPVRTKNVGVIIEITSESHMPCVLQNAEWQGEFVTKAKRL